ncbi:MAG: GNAT family N-acetyltransferase [Ruminococcaceae bacterium]|nr:GNAT family N-acetyltransferase [Oscillospiraceae bacterium]
MKIEIKTERLVLKPLGIEYLDTVHEYASDIENCRYMCYLPNADLDETRDFLLSCERECEKPEPEFFEFAVIYDEKHIGAVSATLYHDGAEAELGWIINKKYWGMGFATEAARALIDYLSKEHDINAFVAHCDSENHASYRVMEKLGMKRSGEWYGRKNRSSDEDRCEYQYKMKKTLTKGV